MHEKSPYMMVTLIGSLIMMMTASLVLHVPKNEIQGGLMSSALSMNNLTSNIGGEIDTILSKITQDSNKNLSH